MPLSLRKQMIDLGQVENRHKNLFIRMTPGIVTIVDANTTIGYCRYTDTGEVEYIFVNPAHRRRGFAMQMLELVEMKVRRRLSFQLPVSPLGATLLARYQTQPLWCVDKVGESGAHG